MLNHCWPLQDAKAHLSALVKKAQKEGPQCISVRGNPTVVVISQEMYLTLSSPPMSFADYFRNSPLVGVSIDLSRDSSPDREIEL